jgi:hypothetical protein
MYTKQILLNNYLIRNPFAPGWVAKLWNNLVEWKERELIRLHLKLVESKLRLAHTGHLTADQKLNREHVIDLLHDYWDQGIFPKNTKYPGVRTPSIRDEEGTLCAMGFLLYATGEQHYVSKLACDHNHVYLEDVHEGPLFTWLQYHGIRKEEAVQIQPTYAYVFDPSLSPTIVTLLKAAPAVIGLIVLCTTLWMISGLFRMKKYRSFAISLIVCFILAYFAQFITAGVINLTFKEQEGFMRVPINLEI